MHLRSVTSAVNTQAQYDLDDNRKSNAEKLGQKIRAWKEVEGGVEGADDAVAYFLYPSISAASKATGIRHEFISNQCSGDAPMPSRQGWRFTRNLLRGRTTGKMQGMFRLV